MAVPSDESFEWRVIQVNDHYKMPETPIGPMSEEAARGRQRYLERLGSPSARVVRIERRGVEPWEAVVPSDPTEEQAMKQAREAWFDAERLLTDPYPEMTAFEAGWRAARAALEGTKEQ